MLYRPLLLLLLLSLLHSPFNVTHLTINSLPMYRSDGVYSLFLFLSISSVCFYSLVHRSDGYLTGKEKEYRSHFYLSLFLLADVVMLVIICVHHRSSVLSFRSKVVVVLIMPFFLAFVSFVFCFFFFFSLVRSLSLFS